MLSKARIVYNNPEIKKAVNVEGIIIDQTKLGNIRFGISNIAHSGCGVVAAYNMLLMASENDPYSDGVRFESVRKYFAQRALLGGVIGTYKYLMSKFLNSQGKKVTIINRPLKVPETVFSYKDKIGAVLFFNGKSLHWSAFRNKNNIFTFYNLYTNEGETKYSSIKEFINTNVKLNQVIFITI